VILIDTSALVDSLCGERRSAEQLHGLIATGEQVLISAPVLFEWLRGARLRDELVYQEEFFPSEQTLTFGPSEARVAARLYRKVKRARGREIDLAIAATAIVWGAALWTLNRGDFEDIPDLNLV
jgi:predicted nucleic acid-binding protein